MVNARTATAADFDKASENNARAFWLTVVIAGMVWWFAGGWWAVLPAVISLYCAAQAVGANRAAAKMRAGTYRIPNVNNGAPDGDKRNS